MASRTYSPVVQKEQGDLEGAHWDGVRKEPAPGAIEDGDARQKVPEGFVLGLSRQELVDSLLVVEGGLFGLESVKAVL